MNAIELIEQGYLQQNWQWIADAYQMMTGKDIDLAKVVAPNPTPKKRGRPKKVEQTLIKMSPKKGMSTAVTAVTPEEFYNTSRGRTKLDLVGNRPNWFVTNQYESIKDAKDKVFKEKVYKKSRTLPKPTTVKKQKFTCRKCGHSDLLYPSQVVVGQFSSKGYYCNTCCGGY